MTKNELMRLLGIEALIKRNTKTKAFETMLDIICHFLIVQRDAVGGVDVASDASTAASSVSKEVAPKRVASVL